MKVLISAYSCRPFAGGEPGVGWNGVKSIAKLRHKVWVITRKRYKDQILRGLDELKGLSVEFMFIDPPPFFLKIKKGIFGLWVYYYIWQILAFFRARKMSKQIDFEVVHHFTMVNDWLPAFICFFNKKFIWGPVGGSKFTLPRSAFSLLGLKEKIYEFSRLIIQNSFYYLDPFLKLTRKKADKIIYTSNASLQNLPDSLIKKAIVAPHINVGYVIEASNEFKKSENSKFIIFNAGRVVHWKGLDLLVYAFKKFNEQYADSFLQVCGTGPYLNKIKSLSAKLLPENSYEFVGYLPSINDVLVKMNHSDVVVIPTLRDGPLVTIAEAMALGKPVICLDIPSQAELIPDNCGLKVPYSKNFNSMVDGIVERLVELYMDSTRKFDIGLKAKNHVQQFYSGEYFDQILKTVYLELENN